MNGTNLSLRKDLTVLNHVLILPVIALASIVDSEISIGNELLLSNAGGRFFGGGLPGVLTPCFFAVIIVILFLRRMECR